eukprot:scaffold1051_cov254-Pinguiococcus_pyrenoidosus.AAC.1
MGLDSRDSRASVLPRGASCLGPSSCEGEFTSSEDGPEPAWRSPASVGRLGGLPGGVGSSAALLSDVCKGGSSSLPSPASLPRESSSRSPGRPNGPRP